MLNRLTAITLTLAALALITPLDHTIAKALYTPTSDLAFFIQEYSNILPLILITTALGFLMFPKLMQKYPRTKQFAAVYLLVALFGVGLTNQLIAKHTFERPRPRENVLVYHPIKITPEAAAHVTTRTSPTLVGKSMPSGHAGLAFLLLIPAFIFTQNRRTTLILATTAITYGAFVGWARITLGAHFLSDILIAVAINLAAIKIATHFIKPSTHIKPFWSIGLTALTLAIIIYTQKLHVTLSWQGTLTGAPTFTFPCDITHTTTPSQNTNLTLEINGKGLPETGLFLTQTNNTFQLKKIGIHYSLKCTGTLTASKQL